MNPAPLTSCRPARRRLTTLLAGALTVAALALTARSITYTAWYQHRLYGQMPLPQLAAAVRREPGNPVPLYYYGRALNAHRRFAEALTPLEQAAGLDPDDAQIRGEWSVAQLAGGYLTGAFGQLTQFVHTHPTSAAGHLLLGRFYVAQRSYIRGIEELEQALRLDPNLGDGWSLLAGARLQMGGLTPARDAAVRAVALRPNSAVDHMLLATLLQATSDPGGACREFSRAAALCPNDPAYQCEYASALLRTGRPTEMAAAERAARRAITLDARRSEAFYDLGRALAGQGRGAEAIEPLRIAATLLPPGTPRSTLAANAPERFQPAEPALELSRAYRRLGNLQEADAWERHYEERRRMEDEERRLADAVRAHPEQHDLRRQMGLFLARRGDVEGVTRNLGKAIHRAPDSPQTLAAAANALTEAGYAPLALPLARRAAMFSKHSPAAYDAWGNALLSTGQPHEAAVRYARAAVWWGEKIPLYRRKIAAYYRQRKRSPSEAERLYEEAGALERSRLGLPFNIDRAKSLLIRAIALEPDNTDYRRTLLRLLMSRREEEQAERAARDLLTRSPEDGLAHALLAIALLDRPNAERDPATLSEAETHLKAAEDEDGVLPTVHYGQGLLALRRRQPQEAVRLLRQSATEEPADLTYYYLAQAERMAGDTRAARQTLALFSARLSRSRQAVDLMKRIAANPSDRQRYVDAIHFYTRNGMTEQATAVADEMRRRFGI